MDNTYTLTADERSLLDEIQNNIRSMEQQARGALAMICKIHGLAGPWNYDPQGGTLTKQGE